MLLWIPTFSCFQNYMRFMTTIIFIIKEAEKCNDFFIFNKSCHCCHYSEESSGTIFSLSRLKWLLMMIHLLLLCCPYTILNKISIKKTIELKKFKIKTCWLRNIVCNWWASEFAKEKTGFFFRLFSQCQWWNWWLQEAISSNWKSSVISLLEIRRNINEMDPDLKKKPHLVWHWGLSRRINCPGPSLRGALYLRSSSY